MCSVHMAAVDVRKDSVYSPNALQWTPPSPTYCSYTLECTYRQSRQLSTTYVEQIWLHV
jgi:hypothetical protein